VKTSCKRDLGIILLNDLKWHEQSSAASKKANQMLGLIKRSFKSRELYTTKGLYRALVQLLLDNAAPVWNPQASGDIKNLEKFREEQGNYHQFADSLSIMNI
jgi:ribonucleases P/MRP protein subunit RPP40